LRFVIALSNGNELVKVIPVPDEGITLNPVLPALGTGNRAKRKFSPCCHSNTPEAAITLLVIATKKIKTLPSLLNAVSKDALGGDGSGSKNRTVLSRQSIFWLRPSKRFHNLDSRLLC
jgi:hypothetical protein